jgi:plasmid maintenance system antidote protein VapI
MKQAIEYLLMRSGISNYKISKDTGIADSTLSRFATGNSDIGKMTLDNAIKIHDYFKEMLINMGKQFGSVTFEGKEYILTQQAYPGYVSYSWSAGAGVARLEGDFYKASAIDTDGNEYTVLWEPVGGWEQMEDESEVCNWDNPKYVMEG